MPLSPEIIDQITLLSLLASNFLGFLFMLLVIWKLIRK
jgi:hypothetical protein